MPTDSSQEMRDGTRALSLLVGGAAVLAPVLHSLSDALEWYFGGFTTGQLWLTYVAFLPMPWLLFGIYVVHPSKPGFYGLLGALLYGTAFIYFAFTALYALGEGVPDYELLWQRLGYTYTVHGAFMVVGGLMFAVALFRAAWMPRVPLSIFTAGVLTNLLLALVPAPDILQTVGTLARNLGLVLMGYTILRRGSPTGISSANQSVGNG